MEPPCVSVLLPIYGDEPFLLGALAQTYSDFEVVAVTESLSDDTARTLEASPLPIKRVEYHGDGGLAGALNAGIERCRGDYVARMDADDVAREDRLVTQVEFLDRRPDVGVLGGGYERIDELGRSYGPIYPPGTHLAIRWQLLLTSCIPHPSAMIRKSVLEETGIRYRPTFDAAEDFDLWTRLAGHTRLRNLRTVLLKYRIRGNKKSERDADRQRELVEWIAVREVDKKLSSVRFSEDEIFDMRRLLYDGAASSVDRPRAAKNYLKLLDAFERDVADGRRVKGARVHAARTLARGLLRPPIDTDNLLPLVKLLNADPAYPARLLWFLIRRRLSSQPRIQSVISERSRLGN